MMAVPHPRPVRTAAPKGGALAILTAAMGWAMILMIVIPGNLDYSGATQESVEGNPITRALWLAILATGAAIVLFRMPLVLRLLRQVNVFFLVFIALAAASVAWSIDPELTARKLVRMLIMLSAFLSIAVVAWQPHRFQRVLRPVVTLISVGSIIFGLVRPDIALHHEPFPELLNAWHGLCLTKNQLGAVASFTFIFWAHAWLSKETGRLSAFMGASAAAACLVLSRSETSLFASAVATLVLVLLMRTPAAMRRSLPLLGGGLIALILIFAIAMLKVVPGLDLILAPIPMITGKDLTFSNRADIWAVVVEHIRLRPFLGSGYGAFWVPGLPTPNQESYVVLRELNGLYPGSSHNGYLQVLNDLGAAGLLCLLGYIVVFFRQSMRLYAVDRAQGALFIGMLIQQMMINLSEPNWLNVINVDFIPISIATACLARALLDARSGVKASARTHSTGAPRPDRAPQRRPVGPARLLRPLAPPRDEDPGG